MTNGGEVRPPGFQLEKGHEEMHEMEQGKPRSGGSGKKVTSRKQAMAIGLSEARRSGKNVPPNLNR
jgi:hypothetical protein